MGILDSLKKLFSGDSQADSEPAGTQSQPPSQDPEGRPTGQAESPAGTDSINEGGENEGAAKDEGFIDLYDDTQH